MQRFCALLISFSLFCGLVSVPAQADVVVSPLRQVIGPAAPAAVYEVSNPTDRIIEVNIDWIDLAATPTGYRDATPEERNELSAAPFLLVSPASVRLEPGARAQVDVLLKHGADIPRGERRSHLMFTSNSARSHLRKAGGGLEVDAELRISTPVILRRDAATPKLRIADARLIRNRDGDLDMEATLTVAGGASSFGRIVVLFDPADRYSPDETLAVMENVAVYPDSGARQVRLSLDRDELPAGLLSIRYFGAGEYAGVDFARRSFTIEGR